MIARILWRLRFVRFGRKLAPCGLWSWWRYSGDYCQDLDPKNAALACAMDLHIPQIEHFEQISGQYVGMQPLPGVFMVTDMDLERTPTWH